MEFVASRCGYCKKKLITKSENSREVPLDEGKMSRVIITKSYGNFCDGDCWTKMVREQEDLNSQGGVN